MCKRFFGTSKVRFQLFSLAMGGVFGPSAIVLADPFYMGSDVSLLPFMQGQDPTNLLNGVQQPRVAFKDQNGASATADQILYDAGDNLFRIRIFVNPATSYTSANAGAIQSQAYDIALAQQLRAEAPGAKLLLDFHYSDSWADPGKQTKPAAWTNLDLPTLKATVQSYTENTLLAFKSAGVMPDMVQVGNETTNGMLWTTGKLVYTGSTAVQNQSWADFGSLLNSAIAGVRAAQDPGQRIPVALSIDRGDANGLPQYFYNNIQTLGGVTDYDIQGVDYYPSNATGLAQMKTNLTALANTYHKKIMLLETNYPYKGTAPSTLWPATPAGQEQQLLDVRNMMMSLPNGLGAGVLYWYPESVQVPGFNIYNGGSTALFDANGKALPALGAFNTTGTVTATSIKNQDGDWNTATNWLGGNVPTGVGAEADLLAVISTAHTVSSDSAITLGTLRFNNANSYDVAGAGSLTMTVTSGSALVDVKGGIHSIGLPVTIASNTTLNVAAGATLIFSGPVTVNSGENLSLGGSGAVNYQSDISLQAGADIAFGNSFHATSLTLASSSTATISAHGSKPRGLIELDQLSFAGSADTWSGKLDLNDNDLIVHNGDLTSVRNQLKQAYNGGNWNGSAGITSSTAGAGNVPKTALGYALNDNGAGSVLTGTFDGQAVSNTDVLVKYTLVGDANLDGSVNFSDLLAVAQNYNGSDTSWNTGDFNYDGSTGFGDLLGLAQNYNQSLSLTASQLLVLNAFGGPSFSAAWTQAEAQVAVPEPSWGLASIAAAALLCRRRCRAHP